jgi:predicted flavoprotein YhiN
MQYRIARAGGMLAPLRPHKRTRVILLEKNEKLGKKLYITGKGRCNLTNAGGREAFLPTSCATPVPVRAWNACLPKLSWH